MKLAIVYDPLNDADIVASKILDAIIRRLLPDAARSEGHIEAGHGIIYSVDVMKKLFDTESG